MRLLAAWGVDRLLLDRPLAADLVENGGGDPAIGAVPAGRARLVAARPSFGQTLYVYALKGAAPEVALTSVVVQAPHMNAAVAALLADDLDPRTTVVLPGDGEPAAPSPPEGATPEVRIVHRDRERLVASTRSPTAAVLVWQRSYLPLYRATVDGREVEVLVADLHRIGVTVPAGEHEVEVWADRRPLVRSAMGSLAGVVSLVLLTLGVGLPGRRRREETA